MVVCMPTTVAGGGRKCYDFCGRWGFDEAQVEVRDVLNKHATHVSGQVAEPGQFSLLQ